MIDRRTRIKPQSDKRRKSGQAYEQVKAEVYRRDGRRCRLAFSLLGGCHGPLTPHHLWKSGQGGPDHPCNIITLCEFHNGRVETMRREDAEVYGLVVAWGQTIAEAWRRLVFWGLVDYWYDGHLVAEPEPTAHDELYQLVRR